MPYVLWAEAWNHLCKKKCGRFQWIFLMKNVQVTTEQFGKKWLIARHKKVNVRFCHKNCSNLKKNCFSTTYTIINFLKEFFLGSKICFYCLRKWKKVWNEVLFLKIYPHSWSILTIKKPVLNRLKNQLFQLIIQFINDVCRKPYFCLQTTLYRLFIFSVRFSFL